MKTLKILSKLLRTAGFLTMCISFCLMLEEYWWLDPVGLLFGMVMIIASIVISPESVKEYLEEDDEDIFALEVEPQQIPSYNHMTIVEDNGDKVIVALPLTDFSITYLIALANKK